jgi:hypothetical protein
LQLGDAAARQTQSEKDNFPGSSNHGMQAFCALTIILINSVANKVIFVMFSRSLQNWNQPLFVSQRKALSNFPILQPLLFRECFLIHHEGHPSTALRAGSGAQRLEKSRKILPAPCAGTCVQICVQRSVAESCLNE